MQQLVLDYLMYNETVNEENDIYGYEIIDFSADGFCADSERKRLEKKYIDYVIETDIFNRKTVSYQANKNESVHNWLKFKEGFSAELVEILLKEFDIKKGGLVMDPFMGSGTTMLVSKVKGFDCIGFDILPISDLVINAKNSIYSYNLNELNQVLSEIKTVEIVHENLPEFNHLNITQGAFEEHVENDIMFFTQWSERLNCSKHTKNLIKLSILNILESVSYTAKDGQYLRWDYRSKKVVEANKKRIQQGKKPYKTILDKGELPNVRDALYNEFNQVVNDITSIQKNNRRPDDTKQTFITGSVLFELPKIHSGTVSAVITSPPYCNRYDYTRTYALELAYLGVNEVKIRELRQALLTCTVENKPKNDKLRDFYYSINRENDYIKIINLIETNSILNEINSALKSREASGEINNNGVLQMVDGYFRELVFTFYELFRVCKSGAKVAFVNDNVRYAGETIPVDFLTTDFAEQIGFKVSKIYTLRQRKGNSSQQMKKFGRVALRKSITIWEKP